jgi:hypothetical protein
MILDGFHRTFLFVRPYRHLTKEDEKKNPFQCRPRLYLEIYYVDDPLPVVVIEPASIHTHTASRVRPRGTFGIRTAILLIHNLNRGRRVS